MPRSLTHDFLGLRSQQLWVSPSHALKLSRLSSAQLSDLSQKSSLLLMSGCSLRIQDYLPISGSTTCSLPLPFAMLVIYSEPPRMRTSLGRPLLCRPHGPLGRRHPEIRLSSTGGFERFLSYTCPSSSLAVQLNSESMSGLPALSALVSL